MGENSTLSLICAYTELSIAGHVPLVGSFHNKGKNTNKIKLQTQYRNDAEGTPPKPGSKKVNSTGSEKDICSESLRSKEKGSS